MKRTYYLSREGLAEAGEIGLELAEEVSFLNRATIKKVLRNIRPGSKVTINVEHSSYIAGGVLELIKDFASIFAEESDIDIVLRSFKPDYDHEDRDHHSHVRVGYSASIQKSGWDGWKKREVVWKTYFEDFQMTFLVDANEKYLLHHSRAGGNLGFGSYENI